MTVKPDLAVLVSIKNIQFKSSNLSVVIPAECCLFTLNVILFFFSLSLLYSSIVKGLFMEPLSWKLRSKVHILEVQREYMFKISSKNKFTQKIGRHYSKV